jgi:DNA-binding IclR family transcriptional regulator
MRSARGWTTRSTPTRPWRCAVRGLSLLSGFGPGGAERGIVELAGELGMSPSTAHRYALTLVELGLLERCPRSRKYRLADVA